MLHLDAAYYHGFMHRDSGPARQFVDIAQTILAPTELEAAKVSCMTARAQAAVAYGEGGCPMQRSYGPRQLRYSKPLRQGPTSTAGHSATVP